MTDKSLPIIDPATVKTTRAPDFKVVYANNIRVGMTIWDVQIVFGHTDAVPVPVGGQQQPTIEDKVAIVLSPAEAKSLRFHLDSVLQTYESMVAPISTPEQFLKPVSLQGQQPQKQAETK